MRRIAGCESAGNRSKMTHERERKRKLRIEEKELNI